jgi:hypothetical protein
MLMNGDYKPVNQERKQSSLHRIGLISSATLNGASVFSPDIFDSHAVGELNQGQTIGTVDFDNTLVRCFHQGEWLDETDPWPKRTRSVIVLDTQALPVNGNPHCFKIFGLPFLSACSIVTTAFVFDGLLTRSIAPSMPSTLLGNIQLARLLLAEACVAPSIVSSILPGLIMRGEKYSEPKHEALKTEQLFDTAILPSSWDGAVH